MELGLEKMNEDKGMVNLNVVSNCVSESCRCSELEDRSTEAEVRCAELEFELQKKNNQCEALEAKLKAMEVEKFAVEEELKALRLSSEGLKGRKEGGNEKERNVETIVDLTDDDDEVVQLMIENKVLECEKKKAEGEVEFWKDKYKKLESWALQLGLGRGSYYHEKNDKKQDNSPVSAEGSSHLGPILDSKVHLVKQVRKQLTFEIEESPSKKMAPSTPIGAKPASTCVIDIIDSDDEPNISEPPVLDCQGSGDISVPTCFVAENGKVSNAQNNEEDLSFGEDVPFVATPKRKRTCNVVSSESEHHDDDDDDDMPISKFKRMHILEASQDQGRFDIKSSMTAATMSADDKVTSTAMPSTATPKRRLVPLRKCARKSQENKKSSYKSNKAKHQQSIPTDADADAYESEGDFSDCEDEGLSDFIVDDSDVSNCDDAYRKSQDVSNDDDLDSDSSNSEDVPDEDISSDSQDESDGDVNFGKILSQIQRRKDHKMEWEFEADMLAAFGKDPELCMKAVCALYGQQTSEEQMSRGTLYSNQRGFSKFDAHRGSTLAEFLTNGDPRGGLKKSLKELQEYDPKAVELCRTLAIRYSKQLYEIYKNKEDPYFP